MLKRLLAASAAIALLLQFSLPAVHAADAFGDLGGVPWAAAAVTDLSRRGVIFGVAPGVFGPDLTLTRAEAATILGRLQGWPLGSGALPPGVSFADWDQVPAWAAPYAAAAVRRGIIQGLPGARFAPEAAITWDQLAVVVARVFRYPAVPADQVDGLLNQLTNGAAAADWARQAVAADVRAGDFAGVVAQMFNPDEAVTRAELAVLLDQ